MQCYLEVKTLKRTAILEIMENREQCKYNLFGRKCEKECGICKARDLYDVLNTTFLKRHTLGEEGQTGLYNNLIRFLSLKQVSGITQIAFENIAQISLYVALEQLRDALAAHMRGCKLNYAPKLETLLTFLRRNLNTLTMKDAYRFMDTRGLQVSAFNDECVEIENYNRRHLIHCRLDFTAGFYLGQSNMSWVRKGWTDDELDDLLLKTESVKRKLRYSFFNKEMDLTFAPPEFDQSQKTYKNRALDYDECDIEKPLMPKRTTNRTFIL